MQAYLIKIAMNKTVNLISYNSTGLDSIKVNWINELLDTFDVQLFQLQEHFKAIKKVDSYFKQNFKMYDSYAIPAINENVNHLGRPRGGLAQTVKNRVILKRREFLIKAGVFRLRFCMWKITNFFGSMCICQQTLRHSNWIGQK